MGWEAPGGAGAERLQPVLGRGGWPVAVLLGPTQERVVQWLLGAKAHVEWGWLLGATTAVVVREVPLSSPCM